MLGRRTALIFAVAGLACLALPSASFGGCGDYLDMPGHHDSPPGKSTPCQRGECSGAPQAAMTPPAIPAVPRPQVELAGLAERPTCLSLPVACVRSGAAAPNVSEPALAGIFRPPRP